MLSLLPLLQVNCEIKIIFLIEAVPEARKFVFSIFIQTYRLSFRQQSATFSVKTVNRLQFPLPSLFSWKPALLFTIFFFFCLGAHAANPSFLNYLIVGELRPICV